MVRPLGVAAAALALCRLLHTTRGAPDTAFSPVNWSLVSPAAIAATQKTRLAPSGCTCVQTSGAVCPFFDCSCTCDLTAGACDAFCCCDTECAADYVASVKNRGLCVDSDPAKPSIEYCSMDLTLKNVAASRVNPLLVESVLCVAVDNNEVVGNYIATPAEQDMAVAAAFAQNPKQYAFTTTDAISVDTASSATTAGTTYEPGDQLRVFASTLAAAIHGPTLTGWAPSTGSTRCSRRNPVRFGVDWAETTCVDDDVVLEQTCELPGSVLDAAAVTSSLRVAVNPSVASTSTSKSTVAVDVDALFEIDAVTGDRVEHSLTAFPSYFPRPQLTTDTLNRTTCVGALRGVAYTIYHNGTGRLGRVGAVVTIGTLTSSSSSSSNATSWAAAAQSFSVRFESTATITRSLARGNLQSYERSGNPGFVLHKPVRVGVLATSTRDDATRGTRVVSEMVGGLSVRGLGDCNYEAAAGGGTPPLRELPVLFGEDLHVSCTLALNASAFRSFCERDAPVVADALRVAFSHVARFGNADPFLVHDDWLALEYDAPVKSTATFTDAADATGGAGELACANVLASLRLEFLVAAVGAATNPQDKIVAARASHDKGAVWTFWKNPRDPARRETYVLTTTVAFVRVQRTALDQWIPPTPPIWFSIPNDVFYPFVLSAAPPPPRCAALASTWATVLWAVLGPLVVG